MHHHLEVVIPPTMNIEEAITSILKPFDENGDDEDGYKKHAFWDFWSIGGRFAGTKLLAQYDKEKLDAFYQWLRDEHVTVAGLVCGKQEISPASQIPKVDAKWNEMFPSNEFLPCPLFRHSNDQYGKGLSGTLPADVQRLSDVPAALECDHVIIAKPSYDSTTETFTGPLQAEFMLKEDAWNGCNHMKVDWDGKLHSAVQKFRERAESYTEEFKARALPQPDWLVVTVDYHS